MKSFARLSLGIVSLVIMFAGQNMSGQSTPSQVAQLRWYTMNRSRISFTTGVNPTGVAFDGANIWVTNRGDTNKNGSDGSVMRFRAYDGTPQDFQSKFLWFTLSSSFLPVPNAYGIAFDGANIWVTSFDSTDGKLTKISVKDGNVVGTYPLPGGPEGIAFDGYYIWVVTHFGGELVQVDPVTGTMRKYPTCHSPDEVAFDGNLIWITCSDDGEVRSYRRNFVRVNTYSVTGPHSLAFDGTNMWVTIRSNPNSTSNIVKRINVETNVQTDYQVGAYPTGIAFDGKHMWVTCQGAVKVLNLDGTVVDTFSRGYDSIISPWGVAFDGANIWVTDIDHGRLWKF